MPLLDVHNLSKIYEGKVSTQALNHIRFAVEKGEFVGIMGPSGSGKTTLLNVIATIDEPTSGEVMIGGRDPNKLDRNAKALFRRKELGFVFQQFNLLDTLTAGENIIPPANPGRSTGSGNGAPAAGGGGQTGYPAAAGETDL